MVYSTDKGREQIAAQRRVVTKRKQRKLELAAPFMFHTLKAASEILFGSDSWDDVDDVKKLIDAAIKRADQ